MDGLLFLRTKSIVKEYIQNGSKFMFANFYK